MKITGEFSITQWQEQEIKQFEQGLKWSTANVSQNYSGDLEGKSELLYHLSYSNTGNAEFTGFERVEAKLNGKSLILMLKHNGKFIDGVASSSFFVTECDDKPDLVGASGTFESIEGGKARYTISYK